MNGLRKLTSVAALTGVASLAAVTVASAATIDLVGGNQGTANGAIYVWVDSQSTGTGVIEPFLRVQANDIEQGYNHSLGGNVPWDTKQGTWTHDLQLSDLVLGTGAFAGYYQFLLDINENNNEIGRFLELNQVQIFSRSTPIASAPNDFSTVGTLRYNSDVGAQGDSTVNLDYSRNPGSGAGDMFMYVPVSFFAGVLPSDYIYFYSLFGGADAPGGPGLPADSDAGFEEWALLKTTTTVPDGGMTLSLLGCTLVGVGMLRRKFGRN